MEQNKLVKFYTISSYDRFLELWKATDETNNESFLEFEDLLNDNISPIAPDILWNSICFILDTLQIYYNTLFYGGNKTGSGDCAFNSTLQGMYTNNGNSTALITAPNVNILADSINFSNSNNPTMTISLGEIYTYNNVLKTGIINGNDSSGLIIQADHMEVYTSDVCAIMSSEEDYSHYSCFGIEPDYIALTCISMDQSTGYGSQMILTMRTDDIVMGYGSYNLCTITKDHIIDTTYKEDASVYGASIIAGRLLSPSTPDCAVDLSMPGMTSVHANDKLLLSAGDNNMLRLYSSFIDITTYDETVPITIGISNNESQLIKMLNGVTSIDSSAVIAHGHSDENIFNFIKNSTNSVFCMNKNSVFLSTNYIEDADSLNMFYLSKDGTVISHEPDKLLILGTVSLNGSVYITDKEINLVGDVNINQGSTANIYELISENITVDTLTVKSPIIPKIYSISINIDVTNTDTSIIEIDPKILSNKTGYIECISINLDHYMKISWDMLDTFVVKYNVEITPNTFHKIAIDIPSGKIYIHVCTTSLSTSGPYTIRSNVNITGKLIPQSGYNFVDMLTCQKSYGSGTIEYIDETAGGIYTGLAYIRS